MSTQSQKATKVQKPPQDTQEFIIKQLNEAELILVSSIIRNGCLKIHTVSIYSFLHPNKIYPLVDSSLSVKAEIESHKESRSATS